MSIVIYPIFPQKATKGGLFVNKVITVVFAEMALILLKHAIS